MKSSDLVTGAAILAIIALFSIYYLSHFAFHHDNVEITPKLREKHNIDHLLKIIRVQNETINTMESLLGTGPSVAKLVSTIKEKEAEINQLKEQVKSFSLQPRIDHHSLQPNDPFQQENSRSLIQAPIPSFEKSCEDRFGMSLAQHWKQTVEDWCTTPEPMTFNGEIIQPHLKCYPYHQEHKKADGRGKDMFCEAKDFFIDFSKISGTHSSTKPHLGDQYHSFQSGSLIASCTTTPRYNPRVFMPHHSLQMRSFQSSVPLATLNRLSKEQQEKHQQPIETISHPVYLLSRDEDCENAFHSTADFMNMFLVLSILNLSPSDLQVMLFDKHTNGPFMELIKTAYSPNHDLRRAQDYGGRIVHFKHLIFHLESPAGVIFPKVSGKDPMKCHSASLFTEYRKFILHSFGLLDIPPPPVPQVVLSLRHRSAHKNVGRVLANEQEVISLIQEGNLYHTQIMDGSTLSFKEQLTMIRHCNILIGVHGAGLMFIMFAAEEAILIEIHPSYRQDRHFRHASRVTGKIYMPVRSLSRETCVGSSDNVVAPLSELRSALDGALRIARSFDDGLSECGLHCPYEILSLDPRLDPHYTVKEKAEIAMSGRINTAFPCG